MLEVRSGITNEQASSNLRQVADLLARADMLLQATYEASDELYDLHNTLEDLAGDFEMEADELDSLVK